MTAKQTEAKTTPAPWRRL